MAHHSFTHVVHVAPQFGYAALETLLLARASAAAGTPDLAVGVFKDALRDVHAHCGDSIVLLSLLSEPDHPVAADHALPAVADLIERAWHETTGDYLIYTDPDVCVSPEFFNVVATAVDDDPQAVCINAAGQSMTDPDCLMIRRDFLPSLKFRDVLAGAPCSTLGLLAGCMSHADGFTIVDDANVTRRSALGRIEDDTVVAYNRRLTLNILKRELSMLQNTEFGAFISQQIRDAIS